MKFIHLNNIIHCSLKPSNILISNDGKLMSDESSKNIEFASQKHMAPELLREEDKYTEKVDVYSFGSVLYFILNGGVSQKIKIFDIYMWKMAEIPPEFTPFSKELIKQCWSFESKNRPNLKDICLQLNENFLNLFELSKTEKDEDQEMVKDYLKKLEEYDI